MARRTPGDMEFALIDRYLLGEPVEKARLVDDLLAHPVEEPAAAPFYRALRQVGRRVADEAFIALRLAMRGETPSDEAVRELRTLLSHARNGTAEEREKARTAYRERVTT